MKKLNSETLVKSKIKVGNVPAGTDYLLTSWLVKLPSGLYICAAKTAPNYKGRSAGYYNTSINKYDLIKEFSEMFTGLPNG